MASESNLRQLLEEILADETGSDWALLSDDRRASLATAVEALPRFAAIRGKHLAPELLAAIHRVLRVDDGPATLVTRESQRCHVHRMIVI